MREWRNSLLRNPAFQRFARRFPLTRRIAARRAQSLFDVLGGFVYSQILLACVQLRLIDRLADGPLDLPDIARACTLSTEACQRLLRAAAALEIVEDRGAGHYGLGMRGAELAGNPWLTAMIEHHARLYADLSDPVSLLRDPLRPTALGKYWSYAGGASPESLSASHTRGYTDLMSASQEFIAEQILDTVSLRRFRCLLDVGGGRGTFIAAAARRAPHLEFKLYDLPAVVRDAAEPLARRAPGLRIAIHGGNFLCSELPSGADIVTLIRVLHDHDDGPARDLLSAAARAASGRHRPGRRANVAGRR